ncbi:hypothetical protein D3C73_1349370 [compost metagenome]
MFNIDLLHVFCNKREICLITETKAKDRIAARHAAFLSFRIRIPFKGFQRCPGILF